MELALIIIFWAVVSFIGSTLGYWTALHQERKKRKEIMKALDALSDETSQIIKKLEDMGKK